MPLLDLTPDQLLTTTRAVRKRLDLSRPVEMKEIRECIEIATQAPTGGNQQLWHFIVVTDPVKRNGLADLYRKSFQPYIAETIANMQKVQDTKPELARSMQRIIESATYLADHLHEVPVHMIPCVQGRRPENVPADSQAGYWGSILPGVWSFMLAARARGLGTSWTTLHLAYEREAADLLDIPYEKVTQAALIPVAYTIGTDFQPGARKPLDKIIHLNGW